MLKSTKAGTMVDCMQAVSPLKAHNRHRSLVALVLLGAAIGLALLPVIARRHWSDRLIVSSERITLPADGREHLAAEIRRRSAASLEAADVHSSAAGVRLADGKDGKVEAFLSAPVNPEERVLSLGWRGAEKRMAVTFVFSRSGQFCRWHSGLLAAPLGRRS